jgi:hypothetical protein
MSIREKLAGIGSAVKEKVGAAFGDPALSPEAREAQRELDEELAARSQVPSTPSPTPQAPMDEAAARRILGLAEGATLDEVRDAAWRLARPALAGAAARDDAAHAALDRVATAAEFLEERLLPLAGAPASGPTGAPTGGRARATSRR